MRSTALMIFGLLQAGCSTSFTGSAHFPGGARGCYERCHEDRMEMDSFIYLGEYSSGCVCRPLTEEGQGSGGAAAGPAAVGVVMQMRDGEQSETRWLSPVRLHRRR